MGKIRIKAGKKWKVNKILCKVVKAGKNDFSAHK